jgi:peptide-methionine (R)-S-oxide reductase
MKSSLSLIGSVFVAVVSAVACAEADEKEPGETAKSPKTAIEVLPAAPAQPGGAVEKSDEEWKKILTPEQYQILRKAGTERADGQVYKEFKGHGGGTYYCAGSAMPAKRCSAKSATATSATSSTARDSRLRRTSVIASTAPF